MAPSSLPPRPELPWTDSEMEKERVVSRRVRLLLALDSAFAAVFHLLLLLLKRFHLTVICGELSYRAPFCVLLLFVPYVRFLVCFFILSIDIFQYVRLSKGLAGGVQLNPCICFISKTMPNSSAEV